MRKKIIFSAAIIIAFVIILMVLRQGSSKNTQTLPPASQPASQQSIPQLVSTKPDPLEGSIISSTEVIELTFSHPLENAPELKLRIEPKLDYKVELSSDRKTAKIIPVSSYDLGVSYTLFIMPDSKFDGGGRLQGEKIFHFQTIRYRGI